MTHQPARLGLEPRFSNRIADGKRKNLHIVGMIQCEVAPQVGKVPRRRLECKSLSVSNQQTGKQRIKSDVGAYIVKDCPGPHFPGNHLLLFIFIRPEPAPVSRRAAYPSLPAKWPLQDR